MTDAGIKKLAKLSIDENTVNKSVATFAMNNLSRRQLVKYAIFLRKLVYENSVKIVSTDILPKNTKHLLQKRFKDKNVFFEEDETVGDGIKAVIDDTIIDLSLKGYIDNTLGILKENI